MRWEGGRQDASNGRIAGKLFIVESAFVLFPSLALEERDDEDVWGVVQ